tara:strand:+ start:2200 stop:3300 length:1101 start_codon:yes stop_codon:yes gene_type:complete
LARVIYIFSDRDNCLKKEKYGYDYLSKENIIKYYCISEFIPGFYNPYENFRDLFIKLKKILSFRKDLIEKKYTHIVFALGYRKFFPTFLVLVVRACLPARIKVIYLENNGFPSPKITLSLLNISFIIFSKINTILLFLSPQKNIFLSVNPTKKISKKGKKNIYLSLPNYDYDIYKDSLEKNKIQKKQNVIVFVDQMYTDHPDNKFSGLTNLDSEKYYDEVNCFLSALSIKYQKKIVICKHPKHSFSLAKQRFKFPISNQKTFDEVFNSFCVVVHTSTAINYPILLYKPIVLLRTSVHSIFHLEYLQEISKILNIPITNSYEDIESQSKMLKVIKKNYSIYIKKFITNSLNSPKSYSLISEYLKKYN